MQHINQHSQSVKNNEVRGVEDVEYVFHFRFSAFSVIEGEENYREECEPLQSSKGYGKDGIMDGSCQQNECDADGAPKAVWQKVNGNGQEDSPKTVVNIEVGSLEENGENEHECRHKQQGRNRCQNHPKLFGFKNAVNGINGDDGKRKGDKNSLIKALHCHKINELKNNAHTRNHTKIFCTVFGIAATLGNHICKNGECESADDAKDILVGEEQKPHVVAQHAHHGNDFELVIGKTEFRFLN